jgi:hypothetical protein
MDAGEGNMKERMLMIETEYSVLKEEMEGDRCGWSDIVIVVALQRATTI